MKAIPSDLLSPFLDILKQNGVPDQLHKHYLKWFRYYLDFCHKYGFNDTDTNSLQPFLKKLKDKNQSDLALKQARKAIQIHYTITRPRPQQAISLQNRQPKNVPATTDLTTLSSLGLTFLFAIKTGSIHQTAQKMSREKARPLKRQHPLWFLRPFVEIELLGF